MLRSWLERPLITGGGRWKSLGTSLARVAKEMAGGHLLAVLTAGRASPATPAASSRQYLLESA